MVPVNLDIILLLLLLLGRVLLGTRRAQERVEEAHFEAVRAKALGGRLKAGHVVAEDDG